MILYESEIEKIAPELLHNENGYTVLYRPDLTKGQKPGYPIFKTKFLQPKSEIILWSDTADGEQRSHELFPGRRLGQRAAISEWERKCYAGEGSSTICHKAHNVIEYGCEILFMEPG